MRSPLSFVVTRSFFSTFLIGLSFVCIYSQKQHTKSVFAPPAVDIDQCANGGVGNPSVQCIGSAWQNGNLNESHSHYVEGEFVPYRDVFTNLVVNGSPYSITIEFDATQNGKHAQDYIGDYDHTETNADPCSGITLCDSTVFDYAAIENDPLVLAGADGILGNADDIDQIEGGFTLFGGTISSVVYGPFDGTFAGTSKQQIIITFVPSASTAVLAWAGHFSTRPDWGAGNSAASISGSPYHMRNISWSGPGAGSIGNQDRSLSAGAVIYPGSITVAKLVANSPSFSSTQQFAFTSNNVSVGSFSLTDTDSGQFTGGSITVSPLMTFGTDITVTEAAVNGWSLSDLACSIDSGGGASTGTATGNFSTRTVTINLQEANNATCTFSNLAAASPSAALASISGQVLNGYGSGIGGAVITVTNAEDGSINTVTTNGFGYYTVSELLAGQFYIVSVSHKRYAFAEDARAISLDQSVAGFDFVANP